MLATCLALVGGAARAAYSPAGDPCSLLTQAQVSAALGVNVGLGKASSVKICRWAVPGGHPGGPALVLSMQDAKAFEFAKSPTKSATLVKTPAPGIGDDAVINTVGVVTATLTAKKGDVYFELHVYGFPVDQTKTIGDDARQRGRRELEVSVSIARELIVPPGPSGPTICRPR